MPSTRGRRWIVPRRDLAAGGATLVRLSHPLLPEIVRARPGDGGLRLTLAAPEPARLGRLAAAERRAYLARLAALLGFLRFHGLGIATEDLAALGAWPGEPERPAPGAPPVPAWRAAPPALALAAAAVRLAGRPAAGADAASLRAALVESLERGVPEDAAADAVTALRALDGDGRPEALAAEFARRGGVVPSRDLAGFAFPCPFVELPGGDGPAAAVGAAAAWIARGAARSDETPSFVECSPGSPLEDGAALRHLARALDGDPRAGEIRALADGAKAPRRDDGPPVVVVALDAERWDTRSRRALHEALPAMGFRVFEACAGALRPWEERGLLAFRIAEGDAASLAYLPFVSLSAALDAWREAGAAADPARFLEAARALVARFDPRAGAVRSERRRPGRRPDPIVEAAALLADGFDASEAAAAAGAVPDRAAEALADAARSGRLIRVGDGAFRFRDEDDRARLAARVPQSARRDAVARLETLALPPARFVPAALARGEPRDLGAARSLLDAEGGSLAAALFARAPRAAPDLGAAEAPAAERIAAARALARLGRPERALGLCPGGGDDEDLARAALLVELRRHAEARRLLDRLLDPAAEVGPRVEALLLRAELDERAHRYEDAAAGLAAAERLLGGIADRELAARAARTAGYLANDLGRTGEAIALFRRAGELAGNARARADAAYDVAYAALDGGRLDVAARELDDALELYAAGGDETRYLSALGNRVDLFLRSGDAAAARPVLERVLAHERAAGRTHQILFAIPAAQELALLEGDDAAAAAAFLEAQALAEGADGPHPVWREILVFEAERRLGTADAEGAAQLLADAATIPDNSSRTEGRRRRLLASACRDLGRPHEPREIDARERDLHAAEDALAAGSPPPDRSLAVLESLAASRDAGAAVRRLLEWAGRFPAAFAGPGGAALARLGRRAAAQAGLARAEERFASFLEARGPDVRTVPRASAPRPDFVAEDASTRAVFDEVARIAPSALALLVRGESGTGKEIVAKEAHRLSRRRGPFVAVNLAALPATLAESELFGHARGAFSGADRERRGLVEEASGGTLFLDEIGDLPLPLQGKLLRVLQESEVRRLGETAVRRVDLRVVAATHRELPALVDRGEFRGDLFYRIAGHEVVLKPLRERPRDRARLIARALDGRAALAPDAAAALDRWRWPGNARELLAALESALALAAPARVVGLEHLPRAIREGAASRPAARRWKERLDDARREAITSTLETTAGRRAEAANLLGISRQSLLYEMKKLGIR
ncbi:MAG: sigma 54-interacting transcriptional regulator [Acidobacteria bacterium]|nr:sigma 54-interacting transcriptional regulator [Acidobacteriota bacterium]